MNPYDPRPGQYWPMYGGAQVDPFTELMGSMGAARQQQAYMNMGAAQSQQMDYLIHANQDMAGILGFTQAHNFVNAPVPPKPTGPEQYGPMRPPAPDYGAWRYEASYAPGRENVWMAPLRDPGAPLLKAAAILAAYPAVYLVVLLLRGLLYAIL